MTYEEKMKFLHHVRVTVTEHPTILNDTIMACTSGMQDALNTETSRAVDMELIAVGFQAMSGNKRYSEHNHKWAAGLVASKLEKWPEHCKINWGNTADDLRKLREIT